MNAGRKVRQFFAAVCSFMLLVVFPVRLYGQTEPGRYRVFFTDKPEQAFDPFDYFDPKAIERRMLQRLPLYDWYDLPVGEAYLQAVSHNVTEVGIHSRWLNMVAVTATEAQARAVERLPFVARVEQVLSLGDAAPVCTVAKETEQDAGVDSALLQRQVSRMGADVFTGRQLNGKGIRIAVFDAGYSGANTHPAFEHLRNANRIIKTWDFIKKNENVWHGSSHGTGVWSCIAGRIAGQWSGLAWDAEFLLARTEWEKKEPFAEEENWVAAAEWADKNGADIINSSLGYTHKRYFPYQMDGKTTFISRGANIAARKGILVVNAAGNEGSGSWKIVGAPADADSVMSIGGVKPCCDYRISFSSYGPTRDRRIKPNLCAQGRVVAAKPSGTGTVDGTSFASPLVAGFAACAWQAKRSLKNMELFRELEKSGHLHPYFDYAHGYGIPSAARFLDGPQTILPTFSIERTETDNLIIRINDNFYSEATGEKSSSGRNQFADFFDSSVESPADLLYYQVINTAGGIDKYWVIEVRRQDPLSLSPEDFTPGKKLRVFFKGYLHEITL